MAESKRSWRIDTALGEPYQCLELPMASDDEGPVTATLVRLPSAEPRTRGILYVHGYNDYFFQDEMARRFDGHGWAFFALDLRKYGRSLRPGQTQAYCAEVSEYFEELDAAAELLRDEEGIETLVLLAHSTAGLTGTLYAQDRPDPPPFDGLILNAAFFALGTSKLTSWLWRAVGAGASVIGPKRTAAPRGQPHYHWSIHRSFNKGGEWEYNLDWKTPGSLPVRFGWIRAIEQAQRRVARGLDLPIPVLAANSARSGGAPTWGDHWFDRDMVLPADRIAELALGIGKQVEVARIPGGMHDLALSRTPAREDYYRRMLDWLDRRFGPSVSEAQASSARSR